MMTVRTSGNAVKGVKGFNFLNLERFRAKWVPVRAKKTRQNKRL